MAKYEAHELPFAFLCYLSFEREIDKVCAMYHLYPTGFEEHCVPTSETGGDGGAALVDQKARNTPKLSNVQSFSFVFM